MHTTELRMDCPLASIKPYHTSEDFCRTPSVQVGDSGSLLEVPGEFSFWGRIRAARVVLGAVSPALHGMGYILEIEHHTSRHEAGNQAAISSEKEPS